MYPLTYITLRRSISPPRRTVLRRATPTAKCFDQISAKPGPPTRATFACWGGKPKDRLCCITGLSRTAPMIGCPEEQRSRDFASHAEYGKGAAIVLGSDWRIHDDRGW